MRAKVQHFSRLFVEMDGEDEKEGVIDKEGHVRVHDKRIAIKAAGRAGAGWEHHSKV